MVGRGSLRQSSPSANYWLGRDYALALPRPINGSVFLRLGMSLPFILTIWELGLLISTKVNSQQKRFNSYSRLCCQVYFLQGMSFRSPRCLWSFMVSHLIPATYLIEVPVGSSSAAPAFRSLVSRRRLSLMWGGITLVSAMRFQSNRRDSFR